MDSLLSILDSIPEDTIAVSVYLIGSIIILWCWYAIAKRLPKPFGGISWVIIFAVMLTPTVSEGTNASIAPAFFGLMFGVLTKEHSLIWFNLSAILCVLGLGLIVGYCWSKYADKRQTHIVNKKSSPL
ncbi:hypothetical protein [Acinetobacter sp. GXMZU3951]